MRIITGVILIIGGILLGIYIGFWLLLVGGLTQLIQQFNTPIIQSSQIAIGLIKIMFSSLVGGVCAIVLIIPGIFLIFDD